MATISDGYSVENRERNNQILVNEELHIEIYDGIFVA